MNSIWNKNKQNLKKRFPALYSLFQNDIELFENKYADNINSLPFWNIQTAKNGEITASENSDTENNILLHSAYNPTRESLGIVNQIKNVQNIIFLGFGLGYQLKSISPEITEKQKLIIFENDINHFLGAISLLDWEEVFKVQNLILAINCPIDQVMPLIENQNQISFDSDGLNNSFIFSQKSFTQHSQKYFDAILELINRNKQKNKINTATKNKFLDLWIRNSIRNIDNLSNHRTVNEFLKDNSYEPENCIVVAAGPSLQKILPKLPELQKKCTIICVETALFALLKINVQPDFIILTDPQFYAFEHIAKLKAPESILILPLSVHPAAFRFKAKEILICSDRIPISEFFEKNNPFGNLGEGGSVASVAWTLAKKLKSKNIYFCGLDLSYPLKETHIKGSNAENKWNLINNRIKTIEFLNSSSMIKSNLEYKENYLGQKVLTDSKMIIFAWWFESQIQKTPEINNYTLTPESLKIPGIQICREDSLIFNINYDSNKIYKTKEVFLRPDFSETKNAFFKAYKSLVELINKAVEKCIINSSDLQNELDTINKQLENNPLNDLIRMAYSKEETQIKTYLKLKNLFEKYLNI